MKTPFRLTLCALAALLFQAAAASADTPTELSTSATSPDARTVTCRVPEANGPGAPGSPLTLLLAEVNNISGVEFSGVHYRPRERGSFRRQPESSGVSQVHVGFFDPSGDQTSRFDIGIRGGPMMDENVQLGLGVDWIHKGENISSVTTSTVGPGGVPIEQKQDIARASVNMFPIMGFVQVSLPGSTSIVPYVGAGGGYQVLVLSGDNFATGDSFEGTFSGWGWQVWGGAALPLSGRTRLTGEVYLNRAELGRDANDINGLKVHETVNGDGMGMRFGLAWGF
jgi:hypothetical protein